MKKMFLSAGLILASGVVQAVTLGAPFSDGAVLQRDKPVSIWGKARAGAEITVSFSGQEVKATAGTNGVWMAKLAPMSASKEGKTLTVKSADGTAEAKDVLVGEVWLCSGQSNMEMAIGDDWVRYGDGTGRMVAQVTHRQFVRYRAGKDGRVAWYPLTPEFLTTGRRSALAVYYGLELYAALDVPIGLVVMAVGGSNIDSWDPANGEKANLFRHVSSIMPYSLRGVLWYQGETNVREGDLYREKMHRLYNGWAEAFGCPGMSFYYVQLAPHDYGKGSETFFPRFLEAQAQFERENPHAAMTVINDTGSLYDIHPNKKWIVAKRLALHAFKRDYAFPGVEDSSPKLRTVTAVSNTVELVFDHASRLYIYHDNAEGRRTLELPFEVAGTNGVWRPARVLNVHTGAGGWAKYGNIYSNTVIVASREVAEPVAVRYAWTKPWHGWLYNQVDLPLGTFSAVVAQDGRKIGESPVAIPASGAACNVLDFGVVGDGVANDAPAINRALAVPTRPLTVRIPKGTYLIGETLLVGSHTTIEADPGARLVLSGAWAKKEGDFLLANANPKGGDTNISIRGGIWDGNAHDGCNVKHPDLFSKGTWSGSTLNFRNVNGLSLANMEMANSVTFNVRMCQIDGFDIRDITFSARKLGWNQDGLHFNGFCRNGRIENIRAVSKGQTNDDLLAFNADDSMKRFENFGMVCGPIENIVVRNVFAEDCHTAVRFLSVTSAISNVRIENMRTGCRCYAINADAARYCRTPLFKDADCPDGVGRLSDIVVSGFTFYATRPLSEPLFCIETNCDGIKFLDMSRDMSKDTAPNRPFMRVRNTAAMRISSDGRKTDLPRGGCLVEDKTPKSLSLEKAR